MKKENSKHKHLTLDDRVTIQSGLDKRMTFKDIAKLIGKDPTTVSKEVKLHATPYTNSYSVSDEICPSLLKAPFVCNGCSRHRKASCPYAKRTYGAAKAQYAYEFTLKESRTGIPLNKESFYLTEAVISKAVKQGQHVYHAIKSNDLPVACSTVYKHIKKGYYTIAPLDLPRAVKFKERAKERQEYVPKGVKIGRTYTDYLEHLEDTDSDSVVQMDTVIGRTGGKVILTLHFTRTDFIIGLLCENKSAAACSKAITELKKNLDSRGYSFGDLLPIILTDNGGEFGNVGAFETNLIGERESRLFFCDANAPYEKAGIEKNHTLLRNILPKNTSFDNLTQDDLNLVFSHINGVKRKKFNGKSAYDMFTFTYSEDIANALGISYIPAEKVIQTPALLK